MQSRELTGCWMKFQDKDRADMPEHRLLQGLRSNRSDIVHTSARRCCGDIAVGKDTRWMRMRGEIHHTDVRLYMSGFVRKPSVHSCVEMKDERRGLGEEEQL